MKNQESHQNSGAGSGPQQVFAPLTPLPPQKPKTRRTILIVALTAILIAGGVSATFIFDPQFFGLKNTFKNLTGQNTESEITKQVVESLFSITTADVDVELETTGPMFASPETPMHSEIHGRFDPKGSENGSYELSLSMLASSAGTTNESTLSIINAASNTYFQTAGLPYVFLISDALNDKWIDISSNVSSASFDYPTIDTNRVMNDLMSNNVFSVSKKLGSETINGTATNHYELSLNKEGATLFASALAENLELDTSHEKIRGMMNSVSFGNIEVWVGSSNFFPYKMQFSLQVDENPEYYLKNGTLSATILFSKLNEAKNIAAPKDVLTLPEALKPTLQGFVGGLLDKAISMIFQQTPKVAGLPDTDSDGVNDASEVILGTDPNKKDSNGNGVSDKEELSATLGDQRDSDEDGLSDSVETLFGTDPEKSDSDGDGFKDGDEVLNGFNPKGAGKIFPE